MRTLVRWSDSSLSMTTPRPEKAEPSRCIASSFFKDFLGLRLEVTGIDRFQARLLNAEIFQPALHGDHFGGRFRPHVAIGLQPQLANAGLFDAADARNKREPLRKSGAVSFDIDDIAAAEDLPTEIRHRTHQRNLARAEQRNAIANTLHPLEQVRRQQNRHAFRLEATDDAEQLGGRVRIETRSRLVEDG